MLGILPGASQVKMMSEAEDFTACLTPGCFSCLWRLLQCYLKKLLPRILIDTASAVFSEPRKLETFLCTTLVFLFKKCSVNFSVPFHTKNIHSFRICDFSSSLELQAHYKTLLKSPQVNKCGPQLSEFTQCSSTQLNSTSEL